MHATSSLMRKVSGALDGTRPKKRDSTSEGTLVRVAISGVGNHRNGPQPQAGFDGLGAMDMQVRGIVWEVRALALEKYARPLPGFDLKVISMYSRGTTTREILPCENSTA